MSMTRTPLAERERLGRNLRKVRLDKGLTQMQLAKEIGVWLQTVQRWETGDSYPSPPKLAALAQALDVTAQDLREEQGNGNDPGTD